MINEIIKTANFCSSGDIIKKINRQAQSLGDIICNRSDKEFTLRMSHKPVRKSNATRFKNRQKDNSSCLEGA